MAKPKSTSKTIIEAQMSEVFQHPPSTVKPGQSAEATRKQKVAIALSKARAAGADDDKPKAKRGSKAAY
jgi:hypothetical protein